MSAAAAHRSNNGEHRSNKPSSQPEVRECNIPGKKKFGIWNHEFLIDEKYEVRRKSQRPLQDHLPNARSLRSVATMK